MASAQAPTWRPALPGETRSTTQRPEAVRTAVHTREVAKLIASLGRDRAAGPASAQAQGMHLTLKTCPPDPSERLADTPLALDSMFAKEEWFSEDGPTTAPLELYAHFEKSSSMDHLAYQYYRDLTNQGSGGKMASTLFLARRHRARETYAQRIRECPELAYVDWSNSQGGGGVEGFSVLGEELGLPFARVNIGDLKAEDLWISYEHYNAQKPVAAHWEEAKDENKQWLEFRDHVAAVRKGHRRRRPQSQTEDEPATIIIPVCPKDVFAFPGGEVAVHVLSSSKAMARDPPAPSDSAVLVEREASRVLVQPSGTAVSMVGRWLCDAEKRNLFSEIPCLVGDYGAAPVCFSDVAPVEVLLVDSAGTIVDRSVVKRCGLLGTAFRRPGAYSTTHGAQKRRSWSVSGNGTQVESHVVTNAERVAKRRVRAYTGDPADLQAAESEAQVSIRVASTMVALPLVARRAPGTFSGIMFTEEIGKKPRTKAFTPKTRPHGPSYHFWPHLMGPMVDYGGSVSTRLKPFLKKRGTVGNMTKLDKKALVDGMIKAREYLSCRRDLRPEIVRPIIDQITSILDEYKRSMKLFNNRHAAVRAIIAVDKIRDPHAQRDQSTSGPQVLREQAAAAHMEQSILAEAAALGIPRVKVPSPDMHNVFGWEYIRTKSFKETCAELDRPVRIAVEGQGTVVDSATLEPGSDARLGAGFAALLMKRACDASRQSEILRRSLEAPLAAQDAAETESAKRRIYASTNLLRTALSARAYKVLSQRLGFFDFGQ